RYRIAAPGPAAAATRAAAALRQQLDQLNAAFGPHQKLGNERVARPEEIAMVKKITGGFVILALSAMLAACGGSSGNGTTRSFNVKVTGTTAVPADLTVGKDATVE